MARPAPHTNPPHGPPVVMRRVEAKRISESVPLTAAPRPTAYDPNRELLRWGSGTPRRALRGELVRSLAHRKPPHSTRSSPAQRLVRAMCARTGGETPDGRDGGHSPPTAVRGSSGYETSAFPGRGTCGAGRPAGTAAVDPPIWCRSMLQTDATRSPRTRSRSRATASASTPRFALRTATPPYRCSTRRRRSPFWGRRHDATPH
jgi:hypothetical protein